MRWKSLISCLVVLLGITFVGMWCWKRTASCRYQWGIRRAKEEAEQSYQQLKKDPERLARFREGERSSAIRGCIGLKTKWDLSDLKEHAQVEAAFDSAVEALKSGGIEDGVPRLVCARLILDANRLAITWVESDFDTASVVFSNDSTGTTVEQNLFENHNLERGYLFSYYRACVLRVRSISDLTERAQENLHILVKYMGKGTPRFGPWFLETGEGEKAQAYLPDGEVTVRIRDKAGNESNPLPIISPTPEMRKVPLFPARTKGRGGR